jgi:hypothetical protein
MPTDRKPISRHLRHRLTGWEELSLEYGEARYHRPGFGDDDARREAWFRHRDWLMARCRRGRRPEAWWDYEAPIPRPDDFDYQKAALWEANLLTPEERTELEGEWRADFEDAQTPDFWLCVGPGENLSGAAAQRAWYRDRGIPRELVRRWSTARRRRDRAVRKLAEPTAANTATPSQNIKENDQPPTAPASNADADRGASGPH